MVSEESVNIAADFEVLTEGNVPGASVTDKYSDSSTMTKKFHDSLWKSQYCCATTHLVSRLNESDSVVGGSLFIHSQIYLQTKGSKWIIKIHGDPGANFVIKLSTRNLYLACKYQTRQ